MFVQWPGHTLVSLQHSRILLLDFTGRLTMAELIEKCDIRTSQILAVQFVSHLTVFAGRLNEVQ